MESLIKLAPCFCHLLGIKNIRTHCTTETSIQTFNSSADNLDKQFGPRSGPTNRRAWSGSKLFDILMVFLKEFFQKVNFEKNRQTTKKHEKLPRMQ